MIFKNGFLGGGHLAAKQKVVQGVFGKDKVTMKRNIYLFEVYSEFIKPKPVKGFSFSLKLSDTRVGSGQDAIGQRT